MIWTAVSPVTAVVRTRNDATVLPSGTSTEPGTAAIPGWSLASETIAPPGGAAPRRSMRPVVTEPPWTDGGLKLSTRSSAGISGVRTMNSRS